MHDLQPQVSKSAAKYEHLESKLQKSQDEIENQDNRRIGVEKKLAASDLEVNRLVSLLKQIVLECGVEEIEGKSEVDVVRQALRAKQKACDELEFKVRAELDSRCIDC